MSRLQRNPAPGFAKFPDHRITVEPHGKRIGVYFGGLQLASCGRALLFKETGYRPVIYIPFDDIRFEHLTKSSSTTYCPFKGTASYWSVPDADEAGRDVMWAYQHPYDEMSGIKDHGAFYADRVAIVEK